MSTPTAPALSLSELPARVGQELAASPWLLVDQGRIDAFAAATGDYQWIHVDPARAAASPMGGTIAHGFLLASLAAGSMQQNVPVDGVAMAMVLGIDRLRFVSPVPAGSRVRARFTLAGWSARDEGGQGNWNVTVEREGQERPALVFDLIVRYMAREGERG